MAAEKSRFILSKKTLLEQYKTLQKCSDDIHYSFKTNPVVGKVLEEMTDCKFAICSPHSVDEIDDKSRVSFFIQGENVDEILDILIKGVTIFVVDNENDLKKLLQAAEKQNAKIDLFIRTKVREHTIYTGKYFVYGVSWERANQLLPGLRKNKSVDKLGLLFHRKTQNVGEWFLKEDFKECVLPENRKLIDAVNIGGGVPAEYVNSRPDVKTILESIAGFRGFLNKEGIKLIAEPGRFLAAPSVRLETEVINVYENNIVVDASLFNGAMDVYLLNHRYNVIGEVPSGHRFLIKGSSPDSLDIFRYKVFFPKKLKVGDRIVFKNAGAYNFHTDFNALPRIKTVIVEKFEGE